MVLTEHFNLEEFTQSATAKRLNINNELKTSPGQTLLSNGLAPAEVIISLRNLCKQVLEPLREHVKEPVIISSGYRCPELNRAVGGVGNSQHITGEACDIWIPAADGTGTDLPKLKRWFVWMMNNLSFDTLILERASKNSDHYWIHVSCKLDASKNRQRVLQLTKS